MYSVNEADYWFQAITYIFYEFVKYYRQPNYSIFSLILVGFECLRKVLQI